MRTLSFLLWTTCSVALGIWLATAPVGGRTPWEHARRLWADSGVSLPSLPSLSMLRGPKAAPVEGRAAPPIAERHTNQERDAVNRLITHRAEK
ncbi:MAG TPA: hypothetical protein VIG99_32710 [Myxococcaceae bacterium]|jgi:hypothetical protein